MKEKPIQIAEINWRECLEIIKSKIPIQAYKVWFEPIKPIFVKNNILTVGIPSQFFYEWLEEHYAELIRKTVRHVIGKSGGLEYIILTTKIARFTLDEPVKSKTIITTSSQVNEKLIDYFIKHPNELKEMDRRLFEQLIAEIFNGFGFNVELTQQTIDGGRDIIAIKNVETELKYLIECKRPEPGNPVSIRPVRELFGVKQDEKATKAILATTTYFTPEAILFSERNKWELELKNFNGVMEWIKDYNHIKKVKQ